MKKTFFTGFVLLIFSQLFSQTVYIESEDYFGPANKRTMHQTWGIDTGRPADAMVEIDTANTFLFTNVGITIGKKYRLHSHLSSADVAHESYPIIDGYATVKGKEQLIVMCFPQQESSQDIGKRIIDMLKKGELCHATWDHQIFYYQKTSWYNDLVWPDREIYTLFVPQDETGDSWVTISFHFDRGVKEAVFLETIKKIKINPKA